MALPDRPRPRAIVEGIPSDSEFGRVIAATCPTTQFVDDYQDHRLEDFDVLIMVGNRFTPDFQGGPRVLWFSDDGTVPLGSVRQPGFSTNVSASWRTIGRAAEFDRGPAASAASVHDLADTLVPHTPDYSVIETNANGQSSAALLAERGGSQGMLAAVLQHAGQDKGEVWCLPARAHNRTEEWLRVAFAYWRAVDPASFPQADWAGQPEWMDADQQAAYRQLADHDQHTADTVQQLEQQRQPLAAQLKQATAAAKSGSLRLLTTQGAELVEAVKNALTVVGFTVTDSDQERPAEKFEDLLVADTGWVAVAEVKGYTKRNARSSVFYQIANAVTAYALREGRVPSARWYVVNQAFETPPPLRPRPLHTNPEAVGIFARDNGLIIDTRDLFRLVVAVERAQIEPEAARELLKILTGVFTYPPPS